MNAIVASKKQEEKCTRRYSKRLRDQNWKHLVNLYKSNNFKILDCYNSDLATISFPFENTTNIKIKITRQRCRRWMHLTLDRSLTD